MGFFYDFIVENNKKMDGNYDYQLDEFKVIQKENLNTGNCRYWGRIKQAILKGDILQLIREIPTKFIMSGIIITYLATGLYKVDTTEVGVVTRFGEYIRQVEPGYHYSLPVPFEKVITIGSTKVRRVELGFRTISTNSKGVHENVDSESLMLTRDLAMVSVNAVAKYKIKDAVKYLYSIDEPEKVIRDVAQSTLRQVIAKNTMTDILTDKKTSIQFEAKLALQDVLDKYNSGIHVDDFIFQDVKVPLAVQEAYLDVINSKEDKDFAIDKAKAYRNQILLEANAEATELINGAETYKTQRIAEAEEHMIIFDRLLERYAVVEGNIDRRSLYLETIKTMFPNVKKIIVKDQDGEFLHFLDLYNDKEGDIG